MARDGAGNYSNPYPDFVANTTIESAQVDANFADVAAALSASIAKDGQTVPTQNLPMGGLKHTGVGAASARTDYARADQVIGSVLDYAIDTGTATAYAIAPSPGISAYVVGQRFALKAINANSGADPTLAVNGLTAGIIYHPNGASLAAGDIAANSQIVVQVATTAPTFHLQTVAKPPLARTGGTMTGTLAFTGAAANEAQGADIASATTTDIGAATGNYVKVTGTTTITGLGTVQAGTERTVEFTGALTLTHNATSLILPGAANITTAAGDTAVFRSLGSGNWKCIKYQKANGLATVATTLTNSLSGNVTLNNIGTWFDGPKVTGVSTATYFVTGTVTVGDGTAGNRLNARLSDGTTVAASAQSYATTTSNGITTISLSGVVANPAGDIRIALNSPDSTVAVAYFNASGNSKDCTITAVRIA